MKPFLALGLLLLLMACSREIDPKKVARVEQNFSKIKPGMTKAQVEQLVGEPISRGDFEFRKSELCAIPPCQIEIWALEATVDKTSEWPHVAIDRRTQKVIKAFRAEGDQYLLW
jgi:hypothetical protein